MPFARRRLHRRLFQHQVLTLHESLVPKASLALLQISSELPPLRQCCNSKANQDRTKDIRKATSSATPQLPPPHQPQNLSQKSESQACIDNDPLSIPPIQSSPLNSAYSKLRCDENALALLNLRHTLPKGLPIFIIVRLDRKKTCVQCTSPAPSHTHISQSILFTIFILITTSASQYTNKPVDSASSTMAAMGMYNGYQFHCDEFNQ